MKRRPLSLRRSGIIELSVPRVIGLGAAALASAVQVARISSGGATRSPMKPLRSALRDANEEQLVCHACESGDAGRRIRRSTGLQPGVPAQEGSGQLRPRVGLSRREFAGSRNTSGCSATRAGSTRPARSTASCTTEWCGLFAHTGSAAAGSWASR